VRKNFFTVRMVKPWNRFPRETVEPPSLKISKIQLDTALNNMLTLL